MAMDNEKIRYKKTRKQIAAKGVHMNGNGQCKDQVHKDKKINCCKSSHKWQWPVQRSSTERLENMCAAKGNHTNGNGQCKDQVQKDKKTNCCKQSSHKWQQTVQRSST